MCQTLITNLLSLKMVQGSSHNYVSLEDHRGTLKMAKLQPNVWLIFDHYRHGLKVLVPGQDNFLG